MSKTYGNDLKLAIIQSGTQSGTWGEVTNDNLEQVVKGIGGFVSVSCSGDSTTVPFTSSENDESSNQTFRNLYLSLTGTVNSGFDLILPSIEKMYIIKNGTNENIEAKTSSSSGITINNGKTAIVYINGSDVVSAFDFYDTLTIGTLSLNTDLTVPNGGTGIGEVTSGAVLIGAGTGNLVPLIGNATNDVLTWNGSAWVSQAGGGRSGSGTVTSVSGSGTVDGITLGGGPITTSGSLTLSGEVTNRVKTNSTDLQSIQGNFQLNKTTPIIYLGATSNYFGFNESGGQLNIVASGNAKMGLNATQNSTAQDFVPFGDNTIDLGAPGGRWQNIYGATGAVNSSDQRIKNSIQNTDLGLSFVNALTPRKYKMNEGGKGSLIKEGTDTSFPVYGYKAGVRFHYGLVSQEVVTALESQGVDKNLFGGWVLDDANDSDSKQSLRYTEFIAPMIKAIQELSTKVTTLEAKVKELESK